MINIINFFRAIIFKQSLNLIEVSETSSDYNDVLVSTDDSEVQVVVEKKKRGRKPKVKEVSNVI